MSKSEKTLKVEEFAKSTNQINNLEKHIKHNWSDWELGLKVINGIKIDTDNYEHLAYMCDWRTIEQLIEETIRAWIVEDIVKNKYGYELNGSDCDRQIAKNNTNITTSPDLNVDSELFEVVCDYGGYWVENDTLEMRANKFNKMEEHTVIIAVDIINEQIMRFEKSEVQAKYIESYGPYGGKSVYSLDIEHLTFEEF